MSADHCTHVALYYLKKGLATLSVAHKAGFYWTKASEQ
jgi:hypothetical protein